MDPVTIGASALVAGAALAAILAWKRRQADLAARSFVIRPPGKGGAGEGGAASSRWVVDRGRFVRGFDAGRVTQAGENVPHRGIDIAAEEGVPVRAVKPGTVREANPISGYGNAVIIEHDGGGASLYGHLSQMNVSAGQRVAAQDVVGLVGRTSAGPDGVVPSWGRTMGSHLHMEIHRSYPPQLPMGAAGNTVVDPVAWLRREQISMFQTRA